MMYKGAEKWSKHLDSYVSVDSPTPTTRRRSRIMSDMKGALPPRDDPDKYPLYFIWDGAKVPCLLALIGFVCAVIGYYVITVVNIATIYRTSLVKKFDSPDDIRWKWDDVDGYVSLMVYVSYCVGMATLACIITQTVCPAAGSSGLPEMRAILSGTIKPVLLTPQLIIAKLGGLVCSISAGLSVGKEGPFVHTAAAVADNIMRLAPFKSIHEKDGRRLEILSHATCAGVAASFGTAFGGVLFSLEFTSTSYVLKMLPEAFVTAVISITLMKQLGSTPGEGLFTNTDITSVEENNTAIYGVASNLELLVFVLMGVGCGLLGALFVMVVDMISRARNKAFNAVKSNPSSVVRRKYAFVIIVSTIVAFASYFEMLYGLHGNNPTKYLFESHWDPRPHKSSIIISEVSGDGHTGDSGSSWRRVLSVIISASGIGSHEGEGTGTSNTHTTGRYGDGDHHSHLSPGEVPPFFLPSLVILLYFPYKLLVTALSVTLPLPVGLFTPVFLCGGVLGRICGEIIGSLKNTQLLSEGFKNLSNFLPREYALIGAAAFSTGVTRAISTAVIIFELSNSPHLCLPISLAIVSSYYVSQRLYKNVYEALMDTGGVPYLQELPAHERFTRATTVMDPLLPRHVLALGDTYRDARELLLGFRSRDSNSLGMLDTMNQLGTYTVLTADFIPLVEDRESMQFLGVVHKVQLIEAINSIPLEASPATSLMSSSSGTILYDLEAPDLAAKYADLSLQANNSGKHKESKNPLTGAHGDGDDGAHDGGVTAPDGGWGLSFSAPDPPRARKDSGHSSITQKRIVFMHYGSLTDLRASGDFNRAGNEHNGGGYHRQTHYSNGVFASVESLPSTNTNSDEDKREGDVSAFHTYPSFLSTPGANSTPPNEYSTPGAKDGYQPGCNTIEVPIVYVDPSPFVLLDTCNLGRVDLCFRRLKLNSAYVVSQGKLLGVLTYIKLCNYIAAKTMRPAMGCLRVLRAVVSIVCSCAFDVTRRARGAGDGRDAHEVDGFSLPTWPAALSNDVHDSPLAVPVSGEGIDVPGSFKGGAVGENKEEQTPLIPPAISIVKTSLSGKGQIDNKGNVQPVSSGTSSCSSEEGYGSIIYKGKGADGTADQNCEEGGAGDL